MKSLKTGRQRLMRRNKSKKNEEIQKLLIELRDKFEIIDDYEIIPIFEDISINLMPL